MKQRESLPQVKREISMIMALLAEVTELETILVIAAIADSNRVMEGVTPWKHKNESQPDAICRSIIQ
jgi:hypothetical protein